jgi:hypothetical protein
MDFDYYCRDWKRKNLVNIDVLFIPHRNRLVNMCGKYVLFKALGGGYHQPTYQQLPSFSISTRALIELVFNNLPHLPTTVQTQCMPTLPLLHAYSKLYQNRHCVDKCRLRLHPIKKNTFCDFDDK